jgi:hypothetical protein
MQMDKEQAELYQIISKYFLGVPKLKTGGGRCFTIGLPIFLVVENLCSFGCWKQKKATSIKLIVACYLRFWRVLIAL